MKNLILYFSILSIISGSAQSLYFPPLTGTTWDTVSVASLGWHEDKIDSLYSFLETKNSKAFILLKNGKIVLEKYFGAFTKDSLWYWASAGKTMTAFMVGIAQHEGYFNLSDSSSKYLGAGWTSCPPEKEKKITILNQLTMTSGLKDDVPDHYCTLPSCLIYKADAGTRWAYHNAPYTLLDSVIIKSTNQSYNQFYFNKVRNRIGMNGLWLPSGYNNVLYSNARSIARFGLLILNKGIWANDTLMQDTSYFRRMVNTSQNINLSYGYLWWLNGKHTYMLPQTQFVFPGSWAPNAPNDMIAALGKNGQIINVVPSMNLIFVRIGDAPDTSLEVPTVFCNNIWDKLNQIINDPSDVGSDFLSDKEFYLSNNYPNPFNPSTKIRWQLPISSWQTLKVYDVLGNEVATLVDEFKPAGTYEAEFSAETSIKHQVSGMGYASGVYFYQLRTENFIQTKKMILEK